MGTWEAPKEVIDQSLGGLIAGFGGLTAGAVAGLQQRNKAKKAAAVAKAKKDGGWRKQLKEIEAIRTDYGKIGNIPENLIDDKFQNFVEGQLKGLAMMDYDSDQYIKAVERVKLNVSLTSQSMGIITSENQQFDNMYMAGDNTGERKLKELNQDGAALIKPEYMPYYKMQHDWDFNQGKNCEFGLDPTGIGYLTYTNPDDPKNPLRVSFGELPTMFPKGEGYFGTVTKKTTDDKMGNFWNGTKSYYNKFKPKSELSAETKNGETIEEQIKSYEQADEEYIKKYRDVKSFENQWGTITQNDWQVMGFTSEFKGTEKEKGDFIDEILERTANLNFKRDDIKSSHKTLVQGAVAQRIQGYQAGGVPGFPSNFIAPGGLGKTENGEDFGATSEYSIADVEKLGKAYADQDMVKDLGVLLTKMGNVGKGSTNYLTGADMATSVFKDVMAGFTAAGEIPAELEALGTLTYDNVLNWAAAQEDGKYAGIDVAKLLGPNNTSDLFWKTGDYGYPNFIDLRIPEGAVGAGGTDAAMVRNLIMKETGISKTDQNAIKNMPVNAQPGSKKSSTISIDREVFEAQEGGDVDRINTRDVSGAQALDMIRTGNKVATPGPATVTNIAATGAGAGTGTGTATSTAVPTATTNWGLTANNVTNYTGAHINPGSNTIEFDFGSGKNKVKVDIKDMANIPLEIKKDGNDYLRNVLNTEIAIGGFKNGKAYGLKDYGFGANKKLEALYTKYAKNSTKGEAAIKVIEEQIIGDPNKEADWGKDKTSILQELQIDRKTFDAFDEDVKQLLVDYKFNTGRDIKDLLTISFDDKAWSGKRGAKETITDVIYQGALPKDKNGKVDWSKLNMKELLKARKALYTQRNPNKSKGETKKDINDAWKATHQYRI
jgi:hypothetical protein